MNGFHEARKRRHDMAFCRQLSIGLMAAIATFSIPAVVYAQTEKLGAVSYLAPKGWTKTAKDNVVIFSQVNQGSGHFCFITLYGVTSSEGNPRADFVREWKNRVVQPWNAPADPKTETDNVDGWTAFAGGSQIDFQGNKAFAFLTVLSGFGKTISILGILNDDSYLPSLQEFVERLDVDKSANISSAKAEQQQEPSQSEVVSTMHIAVLVKEFENNEVRAIELYIGKRVRVTGTVNQIEVEQNGQIILTFKTSVSTYKMGRCYFPKSQSSRVGAINAHHQATVEGTVRGLGGGIYNSKAFLVLENCTVP
jgi:hypothetical protein